MALAQRRATTGGGDAAGGLPLLRRAGVPLSLLVAGGLMLGAMFLPVLQNSDATSTGYQIERDQQRLDDLRAKTYTLQAQIAQLGSESRIQQEAARLGMVPVGRAVDVTVNVPAPGGVFLPRGLQPTPAAGNADGNSGGTNPVPAAPAEQVYPPATAQSATPAPTVAVPATVPPVPIPSVGPPPR
ncbi:MAG TPA: hypothetical protein VH916_08035 [Dehalococcoidia bacterium]|jgi:hypothetical protein